MDSVELRNPICPMKVISNTAISLDGRINTPDDRPTRLGSPEDHARMRQIRRLADAILVGGSTFRHWPYPTFAGDAPSDLPLWHVVVTRRMDAKPSDHFLRERRVRLLFLSTKRAAKSADIPGEVEIFPGDGNDVPVPWILDVLRRRGVKTLLLEAGGDLLYQFVVADALDEMFVTLTPKLISGRNTPTLMDGPGFTLDRVKRLHLASAEAVGDELFLRYTVEKGTS
jgi:2,5-diamino-6-(ribosylamino)-4(3H)-pyrimidinone 5'-phosphate reductase